MTAPGTDQLKQGELMQEFCHEQWRPVRDYAGLYEVSDLGRVRSVGRVVPHRLKGKKTIPTRILKQGKAGNGYWTVSLWQNNKGKTHCVHSLVANAFLGKTHRWSVLVNHLDGDKTNNVLSNLELTDQKGNIGHAIKAGLMMPPEQRKATSIRNLKRWGAMSKEERAAQQKRAWVTRRANASSQ